MEIRVSKSICVVKFILCSFHLLNFLATVWSDEEVYYKKTSQEDWLLEGGKQGKVSF